MLCDNIYRIYYQERTWVVCVWNLMAHGDAREGKWRGNWRMEWVASTLTLPQNVVYPVLLTPMRTSRLPAVQWTDAPADLNGPVHFGERRNLVSACVPSHFKCTLPPNSSTPKSKWKHKVQKLRNLPVRQNCVRLRGTVYPIKSLIIIKCMWEFSTY